MEGMPVTVCDYPEQRGPLTDEQGMANTVEMNYQRVGFSDTALHYTDVACHEQVCSPT